MILNALDYARKFIYFWKTGSPIFGKFDERKYPFCAPILENSDNIDCKQTVLYGPTQSFKTVVLNIMTAYRLHIKQKSILIACQTDDDAKQYAKGKLMPVLERIKPIMGALRREKNAKTIQELYFPAHELIISGPGSNASESKSVNYLHTDEAHLWNVDYPAAMGALTNRMGGVWNRHALHTTTAADAGTEIDEAYGAGQQDEWHFMCIHCHGLIWPKWEDDAKAYYNGEKVFHWIDSQSETETLDSIHIICPHCQKRIDDEYENRLLINEGSRYVSMNPGHSSMFQSYRWNCFAPFWKSWKGSLATYLTAIKLAKLGTLPPYTDWIKKYEVRTNTGEMPMLGSSYGGRNYRVADVVKTPDELRVLSLDVQEGKNGEGFHLWGLCDQWERSGNSKRVAYRRLASWDEARAMQLEFGVADADVCVDFGHRMREVFSYCEKFHWLAMKSGDEESFAHVIPAKFAQNTIVHYEYSPTIPQSCTAGKTNSNLVFKGARGIRILPPGFCLSRLWSKPAVYPMLYALKQGTAGREYNIATDIGTEYVRQLHSYVPIMPEPKNRNKEPVKKHEQRGYRDSWKQVIPDDHSFVCSAQSLVKAMLSGFYPTVDSVRVNRESTGGG